MLSSKTALPTAFSSYKVSQLKSLLTSIGANTSGTKPILASRLSQEVLTPKLSRGKERILSIDMGIKNLAFCICNVYSPQRKKSVEQADGVERNTTLKMEVVAWKRIVVNDELGKIVPEAGHGGNARNNATESYPSNGVDKDPYHPRNMSVAAYRLLHDILLPYKPSTILIERQRFRSGGGSAVQEWTVRVNMLESMLWAVLSTLRMESLHFKDRNRAPKRDARGEEFPAVFDVSPARVGTFWMASEEAQELKSSAMDGGRSKAKSSRKVEKKDKIALVQQWLTSHGANTNAHKKAESSIEFEFVQEAEETKEAFLARRARRVGSNPTKAQTKPTKKGHGRKADKPAVPVVLLDESHSVESVEEIQPERDIGKLDDLADCLLQAAAWVQWKSNRDAIQQDANSHIVHIEGA